MPCRVGVRGPMVLAKLGIDVMGTMEPIQGELRGQRLYIWEKQNIPVSRP